MKKLKRTYMRCALTAALVLLVMLIAGSIWDLPISKFLYPGHESSIGQFFAAFGRAACVFASGRMRRSADRPPRQIPPGTEHCYSGLRRLPDACEHIPLRP